MTKEYRKVTQKRKLTLYIDKDVIQKSKAAEINISAVTEKLLLALTSVISPPSPTPTPTPTADEQQQKQVSLDLLQQDIVRAFNSYNIVAHNLREKMLLASR